MRVIFVITTHFKGRRYYYRGEEHTRSWDDLAEEANEYHTYDQAITAMERIEPSKDGMGKYLQVDKMFVK